MQNIYFCSNSMAKFPQDCYQRLVRTLRWEKTTQVEDVTGRHGARAEMNDNGERWADVCQLR